MQPYHRSRSHTPSLPPGSHRRGEVQPMWVDVPGLWAVSQKLIFHRVARAYIRHVASGC